MHLKYINKVNKFTNLSHYCLPNNLLGIQNQVYIPMHWLIKPMNKNYEDVIPNIVKGDVKG
jgi:hypothetical protein